MYPLEELAKFTDNIASVKYTVLDCLLLLVAAVTLIIRAKRHAGLNSQSSSDIRA